jgi:LysR family transcriptional regulator, cell division regulator
MDAGDLKVFEAVARLGSMNRAALELNTVQSNVTGRIRTLEDELGTSLFERHARGVSPTAAARRLLPYALTIRQMLQDARKAARDDGVPAGPLILGSLETTAAMRLAPLLSDYAAAYPEVDLSLRTGTTCELVEDVLAHRIEGAFVCGPVDHPDLIAETMFREELVALTAHALRASMPSSARVTSGSLYCARGAPIGCDWRRCWRAADRWGCECSNSARSKQYLPVLARGLV